MKLQTAEVVRNKKIAWQQVEEKIVLVSPKTHKIHVLHGSGGSLWTYLKEPRKVGELVDMVCEEYEATPDVVKQDITPFIEQLIEEDILIKKEA